MMASSEDMVMLEDILGENNVRLESGGRITFYPQMVKNEPM